ncbi:hypothetical protein UFOVP1447_67, partial [uncultured Caudovirales phage]
MKRNPKPRGYFQHAGNTGWKFIYSPTRRVMGKIPHLFSALLLATIFGVVALSVNPIVGVLVFAGMLLMSFSKRANNVLGSCLDGIENLGQACTELFKVHSFLMAQMEFAADGTRNSIDLEQAETDPEYFTDLINETDPSKRLYILPKMREIKSGREASKFKTWANGAKTKLEQGIRAFTGISIEETGAAPSLVGKLNSLGDSGSIVFYPVDLNGNIRGKKWDGYPTLLFGIKPDTGSIDAMLTDADDSEPAQIMFTFNYAVTEKDHELILFMAKYNETNMNELESLMDATITDDGVQTNSDIYVKITTDGGSAGHPTVVTGLLEADFVSSDTGTAYKVYDVTDGSDVSVTVVETPA